MPPLVQSGRPLSKDVGCGEGYEHVCSFDQVCHDRLMSRLAQRIADKRVLKLIRASLYAGILENGLITVPEAGTPHGSPLSPFLSHVILDELDKELERRGHRCCRYADDSNICVRSRRAGERVMARASITISATFGHPAWWKGSPNPRSSGI
jgi:retron-type reverse transcriptase